MLVNKSPGVHCLFMLVHSALIMVTNAIFDFNNILANLKINMNKY